MGAAAAPPLNVASVQDMTMRTRVAWAGAAVALSVGGLAACSSSQDVTVAAARAGAGGASAIERASVKTVDVESVKLSLTVTASGVPGANGTATITADGAIDNPNKRTQLSIDLSKAAAGLPDMAGAALGAMAGGSTSSPTARTPT